MRGIMRGYIGITDTGWYDHLQAKGLALEEVNFWQPNGGQRLMRLEAGTPFVFKLKRAQGDAVVGFASYVRSVRLPVREAWQFFGEGNGVASQEELLARVARYRARSGNPAPTPNSDIGCTVLVSPIFFEPDRWVRGPSDWKPNIVQGATSDFAVGESARVWQDCLMRARSMQLGEQQQLQFAPFLSPDRFGTPLLVAPRLGQGAFRATILEAYGRSCALTGEHSVPVLEAAHIRAFSEGGEHRTSNGLLLRADVHKLFDARYVTVTPDARFEVSPRLRADFDNGKIYYALHGARVRFPVKPADQPDPLALRWHNERFIAA
jgi:putative restriction endonuclease